MATRIKSKTLVAVPQSKNDCAESIRLIGDLQREFERERAEMNDAIAAITQKHQPLLADLSQRLDALQAGVQAWCEAHRIELCGEADKLGKTVNLVTGEVSWRQRPPSVSIRGAETVLETLARMGLSRFVRTRAEPNKEAMLNEPEAVRGIAGITIVTGVEDFIVTPFEAKAEVAV
jgi:phage host-nuclease inhibitor protein Gam